MLVLHCQSRNVHFWQKKIKHLGYEIDRTHKSFNPDVTKAIAEFPLPKTSKELQSFLGLASYHQQFQPQFAAMESELRQFSTTNGPLSWTCVLQSKFNDLKKTLADISGLSRFNPSLKTEVQFDASSTSLRAMLIQFSDDGQSHVLEYAFRKLTPAESRYTNTVRELLAAIGACSKKFHHYLVGHHFVIKTDHKPLLEPLKLENPNPNVLQLMLKLAGPD